MSNSHGTGFSRNSMGDLIGTELPEEIVAVNGHVDSWDVSEGAQDDGVGVILSLEVPRLLQSLNLTPRRTIRSIFTTGEELGSLGAEAFAERHRKELKKYSAFLTADVGCLARVGFEVDSRSQLGCIMSEIMRLERKSLGEMSLRVGTSSEDFLSDVYVFIRAGVPGALMDGNVVKYFEYQHTRADTMSQTNSTELDRCLAFFTTAAYILADMTQMVPRG